jgi:enoyl-CoA hydratase/carnithine racemase
VTPAGFESIRVDLDPPVATITLDRPQALNAITPQILAELAAALEWAGHEPSAAGGDADRRGTGVQRGG